MPERFLGRVILYSARRGYGRIQPDDDGISDGLSIFFGRKDVSGSWSPRVGDRVSFVIAQRDDKIGAVDVCPEARTNR